MSANGLLQGFGKGQAWWRAASTGGRLGGGSGGGTVQGLLRPVRGAPTRLAGPDRDARGSRGSHLVQGRAASQLPTHPVSRVPPSRRRAALWADSILFSRWDQRCRQGRGKDVTERGFAKGTSGAPALSSE